MSLVAPDVVEANTRRGWWGTETLGDRVRANHRRLPEGLAFATASERMTWRAYDEAAGRIATLVLRAGLAPGDRVGVLVDDGPLVHAAYVGCERATLALDELVGWLAERGVSKEIFPEHLAVVDEMPTASGGKIGKGALKDRIEELLERASSGQKARA